MHLNLGCIHEKNADLFYEKLFVHIALFPRGKTMAARKIAEYIHESPFQDRRM